MISKNFGIVVVQCKINKSSKSIDENRNRELLQEQVTKAFGHKSGLSFWLELKNNIFFLLSLNFFSEQAQ